MWNMMCDVLPTISEDSISQRSSQFSGEDANFEQLMVSMLDERDKLMDSLREAQERLNEMESKLNDCEKERDSLHRQINANLPQVRFVNISFLSVTRRLLHTVYVPPNIFIPSSLPTAIIIIKIILLFVSILLFYFVVKCIRCISACNNYSILFHNNFSRS
jgi:hypothetical protein